MSKKDLRDMVGYGSKGKKIIWPGNAHIAVQIVLNYEEGAENCVLNGDKNSEVFLSEIITSSQCCGSGQFTSPGTYPVKRPDLVPCN